MTIEELEERLYWFKAKVIRITDGDTIVFEPDQGFYDKTKIIARIYQEEGAYFDTPEIKRYSGVTEEHKEHGLEAKTRAEELMPPGTEVYIKSYKEGSFRWLAELWLNIDGVGKHYVTLMIEEGFQKKENYE